MGSRKLAPELHGLLLVDKPEGLTSAAVVARVKRVLGQRKVGHLGTLDPFATGLLPVCIGEGTKIAPFLADDVKSYVGEIVLGVATDTLDRTGAVVEELPVPPWSTERLAKALVGFRGDVSQTPPMYSALKRGGVPLYRLARAGQSIEREPRPVRITVFDAAWIATDRLRFAVTCSRGTYVRVLAEDLGRALGTCAHLASLRRTVCGAFDVSAAVRLDDLETAAVGGRLPLLTPSSALGELRAVTVDDRTSLSIRRGQQWALERLGPPGTSGETVRVTDQDGGLIAIVTATAEGIWQLARVFAADPQPERVH